MKLEVKNMDGELVEEVKGLDQDSTAQELEEAVYNQFQSLGYTCFLLNPVSDIPLRHNEDIREALREINSIEVEHREFENPSPEDDSILEDYKGIVEKGCPDILIYKEEVSFIEVKGLNDSILLEQMDFALENPQKTCFALPVGER